MANDEEAFLKQNPNAVRFRKFEGITTHAYLDLPFFYLFARSDGHFAFKYDLRSGEILHECDCIKEGRELMKKLLLRSFFSG